MNILKLLKTTNNDNPLKISFENKTQYFLTFLKIISLLEKELTKKEIEEIVITKLQLSKETFDDNQYYQAATELSVVYHMYCYKHLEFGYEKRLITGSDKQPECSVTTINNFIYNAEAKSPKRIVNNNKYPNKEKVIIKDVGRTESIECSKNNFNLMKNSLEEENPGLLVQKAKNNDNKMKDYLVLASEKFPEDIDNQLNLLFVALESRNEIQEYVNFLFAAQGLFTTNSFWSPEDYEKVDFVILTNSYFRHKNNTIINKDAWFLNDGFNIAIQNPHKNLESKQHAIKDFFSSLGVWTKEIQEWKSNSFNGIPQDVVNSLQVTAFIKEELEDRRNIFLFQKNENLMI